jgi:hypothetical protein
MLTSSISKSLSEDGIAYLSAVYNFQRHILIIMLHLNNKYMSLYIILTKKQKKTKRNQTN